MNKLKLLKKIININSFTQNKAGVDKVGEVIARELEFMDQEIFRSKNLGDLRVFKSKDFDPSKPVIILSGHSDTVHEKNWDIKIEGNKMYGPGTNDMKGGLVIIIEILKKLIQKDSLRNIIFSLTPDEEEGSGEFVEILREIYSQVKYGLVFESGYPEATENHIQYSPSTRALVRSRRGYGRGEFILKSKGGHSGSINKKSERSNCILEAAKKIIEVENLADYDKNTTLNVGLIEGGKTVNTIAPYAKFVLDYRTRSIEENNRVKEGLQKLKTNNLKGIETVLNLGFENPPMPFNNRLKDFISIAHKVAKEKDLILHEEDRNGGSDASHMSANGVLVLDGFGTQGGREHSKDEFLYIDSIDNSINFATDIILNLQRAAKI